MLHRYRFLWACLVLLFAFAGSSWARRIETGKLDQPDFLTRLNPQFRGWTTSDIPLDANEAELLEPDAYLIRRYLSPQGVGVELAVVAGHRKRTVHTPGFCMAGGGWETLAQKSPLLTIEGRQVKATQLLLARDGRRVLTTYFFTDGAYTTNSLVTFQASQLLNRLQSRVPLGAVVRILAPVSGELADAERLTDEFAQSVLPGVMTALGQRRVIAR